MKCECIEGSLTEGGCERTNCLGAQLDFAPFLNNYLNMILPPLSCVRPRKAMLNGEFFSLVCPMFSSIITSHTGLNNFIFKWPSRRRVPGNYTAGHL